MTLKVIGAGYGRTGTMSLKLALEQLGFGPCHHMVEVFAHPDSIPLWSAAADGRPDWPAIFEGYASAVDWPTATFYEELAAAYPEAKVILTERDPESWFRSTQATIFAREMPPESDDPWTQMVSKVVARLFDWRMHDHDKLVSVYQAHNARVREVIPPERLLVYEVAQGWEPLCAFLEVEVPDTPMPKVNSTEEFQGRIDHEMARRFEPAAGSA
ncbi:sulfotransferase family protein [Phenylobacterium soli]|uniref:Sulfotransferase family protein n=1 Tax=Phenylobacterium soli TaxID=2170551 RepID=A0A328AN86_9CAUL|nr:sulfotransferase family protein [Phenylobacterium soli]RAK56029.1 sulfotransferase family protein [Phenylobacterium soli]